MGLLYVAGSTPGAGSTAVCAALAAIWRQAGKRVVVCKPLALPVGAQGETLGADAQLLAAVTGTGQPLLATQTLTTVLSARRAGTITQSIEALAKDADVVLVDGLPLTDAQGAPVGASAVLAKRLDGRVLGVQPYAATLDRASAAPWLEAFGDQLAGLLLNRRWRYAEHDASDRLTPALRQAGVTVLGVVPEERGLLAPTVAQVADHLGARFFTWPTQDQRLVEQFILGGLILEWGGNYFGRYPHQAVIVRGGRADIAMSALNFPMSCLILTSCSEPPPYVYQRADAQEVPLLVVAQDTMEIAESLEAIASEVSMHHLEKVERFAALLGNTMDWNAAGAAAGLN
jgi:BioD-like phosphotransacetylase family protein